MTSHRLSPRIACSVAALLAALSLAACDRGASPSSPSSPGGTSTSPGTSSGGATAPAMPAASAASQ